jgi:hypothetical protein
MSGMAPRYGLAAPTSSVGESVATQAATADPSLQARPEEPAPTALRLASLPPDAQAVISSALGRDDAAYHLVADGERLQAANPEHRFSTEFTPAGVRVRIGTAQWAMRLRAVGYGAALRDVEAAAPRAAANRVEYRRGTLTEWYVNGPVGLEQGFTLDAPPADRSGGALTLVVGLSGDLTAALDPSGEGVTLSRADGGPALRYRGLTAFDATGRSLLASLHLTDGDLRLEVDDRDARYPIVVDPFVEVAKLSLPDNAGVVSVAISGDTVVVTGESGPPVAAWVFVKPATGWTTTAAPTAKLMTSDGVAGGFVGTSVAISGDTVVVGAPNSVFPGPSSGLGSAYVFVKPATGWVTMSETAKLNASDESVGDAFGFAVATSGDTVVVGAPYKLGPPYPAPYERGAAYLFAKPASGWVSTTTPTATFRPVFTDPVDEVGEFGFSVAISGDTVIVGSWLDTVNGLNFAGSAYVYVKPPAGWATAPAFDARLTASDAYVSGFGATLAVSPNGDTAAISAYGSSAVYIYLRPATGWATTSAFTAKLAVEPAVAGLGSAIGLTEDALVVGADGVPAAYVFVKPASGWATTSEVATTLTTADASSVFGLVLNGLGISGDTIVAQDYANGVAYLFGTPGSDLCAGVVCTPSDQCHDAGVCDTQTGICSNPAKTNGASCNDGSSCTQVDTCQGGACTGGDYSWSGVLQPINADGSSIFKLGSTLPVKFRLTGGCSGNSTLVAHIYVAKISNNVVGTEMEAASTSAADSGNTFRYVGSDQYLFNLATKPLSTGTWQIRIDLGDGVANRVVNVSLKK